MFSPADLPQEVLSVLPGDPHMQLELAHRITAAAFNTKVAQVEVEAQQLRDSLVSKQATIKGLERRVSSLEQEVQELSAKNKAAVEEQHRMSGEKNALIDTVKRLNRDIAKLEAFKRSLIQHLQEEDGQPGPLDRSMAAVDLSSERLVADVLNSVSKGPNQTNSATHSGAGGMGASTATSNGMGMGGFSSKPRAMPMASINNMNWGSERHGAATPSMGNSPPRAYGMHQQSGGPPSAGQQQGAPSLPTPQQVSSSQGAPMDGKEFFKLARARLSYEQFSTFLSSIKDLNAGRLTREHTIALAQDTFGPQNSDVFHLFQQMLARHGSGFG